MNLPAQNASSYRPPPPPANSPTESAVGEAAGSQPAVPSGHSISTSRVLLYVALAVSGATADLWTKQAIFSWRGIPGTADIWWIVEGVLGVETAVNIGAVFGVGAGKGTLFAAFSVVAFIGILLWLFWFRAAQSLWLTWALGMITGGIIGNLYDRLGIWWQDGYPEAWQSGVRDWILFRIEGLPGFDPWPNFNIADSLLVVGACMLLIQSCFPGLFEKSAEPPPAEPSTAEPSTVEQA